MKLGIIALAAAVTLAAQLPAQTANFDGFIESLDGQEFDVFADAPDWRFFRTNAYCYAAIDNDMGTLLIGYDQRRDHVHVAFWNDDLTGMKAGDTAEIEMVFHKMLPSGKIGSSNRDWGLGRFFVATNRSGHQVFSAFLNGQNALSMLSRFDLVSFFTRDGLILQTFHLAKSSQALRRLAVCRPR